MLALLTLLLILAGWGQGGIFGSWKLNPARLRSPEPVVSPRNFSGAWPSMERTDSRSPKNNEGGLHGAYDHEETAFDVGVPCCDAPAASANKRCDRAEWLDGHRWDECSE